MSASGVSDVILRISLPLLVVAVTALLGLRHYYRQREHEIILERYLKGGVDLISSHIDEVINVFNEGWKRSTTVLKVFRDTQNGRVPMPKDLYSASFRNYDPALFAKPPFYKLRNLVGDNVFWYAYQALISFVDLKVAFFQNDLCLCIGTFIENPQSRKATCQKIYDFYMGKLKEYMAELDKFEEILKELQNIAAILERKKWTFAELESVRRDEDVRGCVERLKEKFDVPSEEKLDSALTARMPWREQAITSLRYPDEYQSLG